MTTASTTDDLTIVATGAVAVRLPIIVLLLLLIDDAAVVGRHRDTEDDPTVRHVGTIGGGSGAVGAHLVVGPRRTFTTVIGIAGTVVRK